MATHPERLLPYLRRLVSRPSSGPLTDALLLDRFVRHKDENAFAALVERHGVMVLGVCRRVLRNAHDAEDAAQATFLVLARKADTIRRADTLAAWLHRTSHNLARKCQRADTCRRAREQRSFREAPATSQPDPLEELSVRELWAIVDEELQRLPEVYRLPLILCYLEGRTQDDAARQLGWTAGSVKGRLERGRDKLHQRLVRRGLTLSAAMLALGAIRGVAPAGMPARLNASLARAATAMTSGGDNGGISAGVTALAEAGVRGVAVSTRLMAVSTLLLMTGVVAVGVGLLAQQVPSVKQPEPKREVESNGRAERVAQAKAQKKQQPRVDSLGDPLPEGAIARVGSSRLHADALITVAAFSHDGRWLAYGTENSRVHVCKAADAKPRLDLPPDDARIHPVTELAISPDGRTLAVGGYWSEAVRLVDLNTRKVRHAIPNSADGQDRWARVWQGPGFAFTPDGRTLVVGGKDGALHLWDTATGKEQASLPGEKELVTSLTLTADGRTALTAHDGGALHLWDVTNRKHLRKLDTSAKHPHLTALAPDGKTVALAAGAAEVELWDLDGDRRHQIRTAAPLAGLGFAPAGASLLVADGNGKITEWDTRTGKQRKSVACEGISLKGAANDRMGPKQSAWFRPDGKAMAWADLSTLRPWDLTTGKETPRLPLYRQGVVWAGFSADGRLLRAGGARGELGVWDSATGRPHVPFRNTLLTWDPHYTLAPDRGKIVAVTGGPNIVTRPKPEDGRIFLWDPAGDMGPIPLREQAGPAWYAALTPDNRFLAATETTGQIRVYDAAAGKPTRSFDGRKYEYHPTFSPDGALLATTASDGVIRLYDFASGRLLRELKGQFHAGCLAFSPNGRTLASGHFTSAKASGQSSEAIYLWDIASGRELRRIPTKHGGVQALSFCPDGRLLASCGLDGAVRVWEAASGQERRGYEGHRWWVLSVDFAPDGRRLASASLDGTALVWQVFGPVPAELRSSDLEALWSDLAKDGITAHRAMAAMIERKGTAAFLGRRVKPAVKPSEDRLKKWLSDLGSPAFQRREAAHREIARAGELIEPALRHALEETSDAEVRRRLTALLDGIGRPETRPQHLRDLRAVEVLELLGGTEVRLLLGELAKGAPEARLTREAKAGLTRLEQR